MASTSVYNAIKGRLVTVFGGTYPVMDWEEIDNDLSRQDAPFLALDGGVGSATLNSIGTPSQNWVRDTGTSIVHVFVPATGGLSVARSIGDQIVDAMQFYRFTVPTGETLRTLKADPPAAGVIADGLWHSMIVAVDYEHLRPVATAA